MPQDNGLIALTLDCFRMCNDTVQHCLVRRRAEPKQIRLLLDCAQACAFNAERLMTNGASPSDACAALCERCAATCEQIDPDDLVQGCIEALRRYAAASRRALSSPRVS